MENNLEGVEVVRRKCLFIDDTPDIIKAIQRLFREYDNFTAVECHSVAEAEAAIKSNSPEVLFLDHSLTRGGAEGLEVAKKVAIDMPEVEIISTTSSDDAIKQYDPNIKHISKMDFQSFEKIIAGE